MWKDDILALPDKLNESNYENRDKSFNAEILSNKTKRK